MVRILASVFFFATQISWVFNCASVSAQLSSNKEALPVKASCSFFGDVTRSDSPAILPGVVEIKLFNRRLQKEFLANTDESGRFEVRDVPEGEYIIEIGQQKLAETTRPQYLSMCNQDKQSAPVHLTVVPAGIATGHLTNLPKANDMWVTASRVTLHNGKRTFQSSGSVPVDNKGNFKLGGLSAGEYIFRIDFPVFADESARMPDYFIPAYFPGVHSRREAEVYKVEEGGEIRLSLEIKPMDGFKVKAKVEWDKVPTRQWSSVSFHALEIENTNANKLLNKAVDENGYLELQNVPTGCYLLEVTIDSDNEIYEGSKQFRMENADKEFVLPLKKVIGMWASNPVPEESIESPIPCGRLVRGE